MEMMIFFIIIGIVFVVFTLLTISYRKQVLKDWQTLEDLEKKSLLVKTKKEVEDLHSEFVEKANKINNPVIRPRLNQIDGYLKGKHEILSQKQSGK